MNITVNPKFVQADFVIHYSQEIDPPDTANPSRILGVCFQHIQSGQQTIISERDEKHILQGYLEFLGEHTEAIFAHWNMRTAMYGFDVLQRRCTFNKLAFSKPKPDKLFDVSIYMRDRYGDDFAPHPRLPSYLEKRGWYDGRLESFVNVRHDAPEELWQGHRQWLSERAASIAKIFRDEQLNYLNDSTQHQKNGSLLRKDKRSTERNEAKEKLIAALTKHHQYADGGCLNIEPIGNNDLANLADVSKSTASAFFAKKFGGHRKYQTACADKHGLVAGLKLLNQEFTPHLLLWSKAPGEGEREDEE